VISKTVSMSRISGDGSKPGHGRLLTRTSGLWIVNGEVAYPVEEITVAGNLKISSRIFPEVGATWNSVAAWPHPRFGLMG